MNRGRKVIGSLMVVAVFALVFLTPVEPANPIGEPALRSSAGGASQSDRIGQEFDVLASEPVTPTLSVAVRDLPPVEVEYTLDREINPRLNLNPNLDEGAAGPGGIPGGVDPLLARQADAPAPSDRSFLTPILNLPGQDYTGVNPPDTVGDVGPNHYIQIVNSGGGGIMRIYDKAGSVLNTVAIDTLGSGACGSGFGDGIALYDRLAGRWMVSEFAGSGNHLCVYVSQTADPLGAWFNYDFTTPTFPDYPKYAVWPDAYYVSTNETSPTVYALDRVRMLAGQPASSQRFTATRLLRFGFQALLPSDLDGPDAPPTGSPNYFIRHRDDEAHNPGSNNPNQDFLEIWQFDVDWVTPANSSFTGPLNVPIAEIDSELCGYTSFNCFPQQGSLTTLDPLREVVMWRLQYRNFGSHETLVGNLVTDVDGTNHGGIRWFELRKTGAGNWSLFQEGTYAPDAHHRWMGSAAMDSAGNIALGYSVSSNSMFPSIRYAGRLASDPPGTLPQGEVSLFAGTSANGSNRWGDYSSLNVDPADDCTFWYTNMYSESGHWNTRIGVFKFDACGFPNFSVNVTPDRPNFCLGEAIAMDVAVASFVDFADPVSLSASGHPGTASFSPNPVTPPANGTANSTLTLIGAAPGTYNFDVTGTSGPLVRSDAVQLGIFDQAPAIVTLLAPANGASGVSQSPTFQWSAAAQAVDYRLEVATDAGFGDIVYAATVAGTSHTANTSLAANTTHYWRVTAVNPCGSQVSSAFTFTTGEETCVATVALEGSSTRTDLKTLRRLRDEVLATSPRGQAIIELYYRHSPEVVSLLLKDAELRSQTTRVLHQMLPGVEGLLGESGGQELVLTPGILRQADGLLDEYATKGSPALRAAIEQVQAELEGWEGQKLEEVLR